MTTACRREGVPADHEQRDINMFRRTLKISIFLFVSCILSILPATCDASAAIDESYVAKLFLPSSCRNTSFPSHDSFYRGFHDAELSSQREEAYWPEMDCSVQIVMTTNQGIRVRFEKLDIRSGASGSCADWLQLLERDENGREVALRPSRICGTSPPEDLTILQEWMKVRMVTSRTDSPTRHQGFRIFFRRIERAELSGLRRDAGFDPDTPSARRTPNYVGDDGVTTSAAQDICSLFPPIFLLITISLN